MTSLKVNETDYEWEKIKNHTSGVWNSSDIGLDLGKLHNQIQTLEHSRLDLTALEQLMTFFTLSLTSFQEKTFCLISLDTSLLVL